MTATLVTAHARRPRADGRPLAALWLVRAPWAHPIWSDYLISLCDLTTDIGTEPIIHDGPKPTHEVVVWAIDPNVGYQTGPRVEDWKFEGALLRPHNHEIQFRAPDDAGACTIIEGMVRRIHRQELSPDSDANEDWRRLLTAPIKGGRFA